MSKQGYLSAVFEIVKDTYLLGFWNANVILF